MKVGIVGSRGVVAQGLERFVFWGDEIVSGGAKGVDQCAADYARAHGLKLTEFLPQYERYGRAAPLIRNREIVEYADKLVVFWDGHSKGTHFVIQYAARIGKPCEVVLCP